MECLLLAQSGHRLVRCTCLLSGVKRTCRFAVRMSALTQSGHQAFFYSITSSAKEISPDGMVSPSDLAVLRLITNSYLVG